MTGRNPWEVLGVAEGASDRELRRAYRRRVLQTHPDRGGDPRRLDEVVRAYGALRAVTTAMRPAPTPYDRWLRADEPPRPRSGCNRHGAGPGASSAAPRRACTAAAPGAFAAVLAAEVARTQVAGAGLAT